MGVPSSMYKKGAAREEQYYESAYDREQRSRQADSNQGGLNLTPGQIMGAYTVYSKVKQVAEPLLGSKQSQGNQSNPVKNFQETTQHMAMINNIYNKVNSARK